jgi:hypothetical protein
MWSIVTFGLICAAAVAVTSCVKVDRTAVMTAALTISANWLLFSMPWIYAPASLAFIAADIGLAVTTEETWSVIDLCSLVVVGIVCRHVWWSPILWSTYLVTLAMHAVAAANGLEYLDYRRVLDAALILQLATLFVVGGGDCADRLFDCWRSVRGVRGDSRRVAKVTSR